MGLFETKLEFVKTVELDKGGLRTYYSTKKNGFYVKNSVSSNKEVAENFFNSLVELKGKAESSETIKTVEI